MKILPAAVVGLALLHALPGLGATAKSPPKHTSTLGFKIPSDFLRQVATVVVPGTTLVVTQPAARASTRTTVADDFTVMSARALTRG